MTITYPAAPEAAAASGRVFRTELNPADFLSRVAYMYPDKTAVVDGGRRYSYRQFADRSWQLANALRSAGLGKGDRVATLLFNSAPMLEAHFAAGARQPPRPKPAPSSGAVSRRRCRACGAQSPFEMPLKVCPGPWVRRAVGKNRDHRGLTG